MAFAHQFVHHPCYNNTLKVAATTVGRDKVYRTIQYFARFAAYYALRKGYSKDTVERLTALKLILGVSRKLMRIGKPLEHIQSSVKANSLIDPVLRATTIGRQIGYAGFLTLDNISWFQAAKVAKFSPATSEKITTNANRFWLAGIAFSIVHGGYRLNSLRAKFIAASRQQSTPEKEAERKIEVKAIQKQVKAVRFQLVQDVLDILIPATNLNILKLDDGIVGLAGTITSLQGLKTQIDKVLSA